MSLRRIPGTVFALLRSSLCVGTFLDLCRSPFGVGTIFGLAVVGSIAAILGIGAPLAALRVISPFPGHGKFFNLEIGVLKNVVRVTR